MTAVWKNQLILFGGRNRFSGSTFNDTWRLEILDDRPPIEAASENRPIRYVWHPVEPKGDLPEARCHASAVLRGDCLVVFGGLAVGDDIFSDVHSLDLSANTWTAYKVLAQSLDPPFLYGHAAVLVDNDLSMLVFGGRNSANAAVDNGKLFKFTFTTEGIGRWAQVPLGRAPPPMRYMGCLLHQDYLLVFGGKQAYTAKFNTLWAADLLELDALPSGPRTGPSPWDESSGKGAA